MKNERKRVHEKYHASTKRATKIINDKNFTYRLLLKEINPQLKNGPYKILDIGCGAGTVSFYLADKGHHVTGIDISKKAINECLKSTKLLGFKNVTFQVSDFPNDFKTTKKFDIIIFTEVIEHLENDKKAIELIYKLLNRNGHLILSTPSIYAPLARLGLTKDFDKRVGHLRRYTANQLEKLLKENGFKVLKVKKTEGILRNFLFINPIAGKLIRYINFAGSDLVTWLDKITLKLFGESNYIIIAKKR